MAALPTSAETPQTVPRAEPDRVDVAGPYARRGIGATERASLLDSHPRPACVTQRRFSAERRCRCSVPARWRQRRRPAVDGSMQCSARLAPVTRKRRPSPSPLLRRAWSLPWAVPPRTALLEHTSTCGGSADRGGSASGRLHLPEGSVARRSRRRGPSVAEPH